MKDRGRRRANKKARRHPARWRVPEPHPALLWGALVADLIALVSYAASYGFPLLTLVIQRLQSSTGVEWLLVANLLATVVFGRK